jgi:formate hydrogenlyase subunit 4
MNGLLAFVIAVLIYPGIVAALLVAWALGWVRDAARTALASGGLPGPLAGVGELRALVARDTLAPEGAQGSLLGLVPLLALASPIAALVLLPVPGNPLAAALGLKGDLVAEGALLFGVPCARLFVGWATPSPYTRLAADRGARLVAGCALPLALAVAALGQQVGTFQITGADARLAAPLSTLALLARLLAAAAFACCLPVLAHASALREGEGGLDLVAGELTEASGRDLALFRVGEALQLVAATAFFVAAFILPLLANAPSGLRAAAWPVALLLGVAGIGAWEGVRGARPATATGETPPLSWWFGVPVLLALFALVVAAFAARGS